MFLVGDQLVALEVGDELFVRSSEIRCTACRNESIPYAEPQRAMKATIAIVIRLVEVPVVPSTSAHQLAVIGEQQREDKRDRQQHRREDVCV